MPVYEYRCEDCGKKFDIVATITEKETGLNPVCPGCGGTNVRQVFGRFLVLGGSKTEEGFEDEGLGGEESGEDFEEFGDFEDEDFGGEDLDEETEDLDLD